VMMMMMRQFCLRDCVYLAFRSTSWHHHFTALCDEGDDHDDALKLNLLFQNGYRQVYC